MVKQTSTLWERLKICWHALTKKNYVFFGLSDNPIIWNKDGSYNGINRNALACYTCISYDYKFNTDEGVKNLHDYTWSAIETFAKEAQEGKH